MTDFASRQTRTETSRPATAAPDASPGKRTLVEQLPAVQLTGAPAHDETAVHAAAGRGVATPSSSLPHGDAIQRAFGRHDVSGVQAHTGDAASASAREMGADAYATGNHVVLGNHAQDLFTVAHEAAHVVQQRGGVQLHGGVGAQGDTYERHADAVASQVVQGNSAEHLLDAFAGPGASASPGATPQRATQRTVHIGGTRDPNQRKLVYIGGQELATAQDVQTAWQQLQGNALLQGIQNQAHAVLSRWILAAKSYNDPSQVSEHRGYPSYDELARALAGEVHSQGALQTENQLATAVRVDQSAANAAVGRFLERLKTYTEQHASADLAEVHKGNGRYAGWAYDQNASYASLFENVPADVLGRVGFIADYSLSARKPLATGANFQMPDDMKQGRDTAHNTNENAPWVRTARQTGAALSAGPSATTSNVMALAVTVGASQDEINGLAWGLFAIWNIMPMHKSGTHRFHEVMGVAQRYNVPYQAFVYPNAVPDADFQPQNQS